MSKKLLIILLTIFAISAIAGTFIVIFLNRQSNQPERTSAQNLPTARTFKVDPFPVPASGHYTSEKNGDWDFASQDEEGWIKARNNSSSTKQIGWQIDCRPDKPGGDACWDNNVNPKGTLTIAPGEAWEVLVGRLCLPYQLDFTGPDFGRYIAPDTSLCSGATPTATATSRPTATATATATSTARATATATATSRATATATARATATATAHSTATATAIASTTASPSTTAQPSSSATASPAPTSTATASPTSTPTVAQSTTTPAPDNRAVADASKSTTLPEAGFDHVSVLLIGGVSVTAVGLVLLLKKKRYY